MQDANARAKDFVARMVDILIDRFRAKQEEVMPELNEEGILRASGKDGIVEDLDALAAISEEIEVKIAAHRVMVADFDETYDPDTIINNVLAAREAEMEEAREAFEFRVRDAIGLAELVGTENAYQVLQGARLQIRKMGQE